MNKVWQNNATMIDRSFITNSTRNRDGKSRKAAGLYTENSGRASDCTGDADDNAGKNNLVSQEVVGVKANDDQNPPLFPMDPILGADDERELNTLAIWSVLRENWRLVLMCLGISFTGFYFGYDTGTIGGITSMQPWLKRFGHYNAELGEYEMQTIITGLVVSAFHIGCIVGGFTIARLSDKLGRRVPIAIACVLYMVGLAVQMCSTRWYQFMIGRIITGLTIGANAVLTPMFLSEISLPSIRGVIVNFYQIFITHGILVGYIVDYASKETYKSNDDRMWRLPLIGGYVFSVVILPVLVFVPESPRYLIQHDRFEEAKKCISRLKGRCGVVLEDTDDEITYVDEVEEEFQVLKAVYQYQENQQNRTSFWTLFSRRYIKRTVSGMCIMGFQQLTGVDYFLYYGTRLFKSVGLDDSYVTSIIFGAILSIMAYVAISIADHVGRKRGLLYGSVGLFVCLMVFSTVGVVMVDHGKPGSDDTRVSGAIMIVFACLFLVMYCSSWAAIAPVLISEIFTLEIKSRAMALSISFNWGANFFIALCTPIVTAKIGYGFGYVFAGCIVASVVFVHFMLPETKAMTLEEIDDYYEGRS